MCRTAYFCWLFVKRTHREGPGPAALEEPIGVGLVRPAEEMRLGIVFRRSEHGRALRRWTGALERLAALERIDTCLRFLCNRPFLVTARHMPSVRSNRA